MSFSLDLQRFAAKAKANVDQVVQQVTISVSDSLITKSPVDTGRFRANWQVGQGAIDAATTDGKDKEGELTKDRLAAEIQAIPAGGVTYISNSLPYAQALEYGHSQAQAPNGMVRVTAAEFQKYVDDAVARLDK